MNANVNAKNKLIKTPLHYASKFRADFADEDEDFEKIIETIKLLLDKGANPSIKDKVGKYPYQYTKDERIRGLLKPLTRESSRKDNMRESSQYRRKIMLEMTGKDKQPETEIVAECKPLKKSKLNEIQEADEEVKAVNNDSGYTERFVDPSNSSGTVSNEISLEPVEIMKEGKLVPNSFEIMKPLGAGAFGQVWLVKNKNNGEMMAMKCVDKELLAKNGLTPYMKTEKNIMLKIDHPFIVNLKHSFQTPEKFFLLMEYC